MKLSFFAALLSLVFFSACSGNDQAPNAPTTDDVAAAERPEGAGAETACVPERDQDVPSPGACASIALGSTNLEVQYGSPSKNDREVFGGLVPNGEVWRTGANEATVFKTDGPLTIGGKELPAGSYSLFTIPGETEWTIIFNSVADQWGAFDYDARQDVLRSEAASSTVDAPQEQFLISFEPNSGSDATMVLAWDKVRVPVSVAVED